MAHCQMAEREKLAKLSECAAVSPRAAPRRQEASMENISFRESGKSKSAKPCIAARLPRLGVRDMDGAIPSVS